MSESYIEYLRLIGHLTENIARKAIESMQLVEGSCGIDAGCGVGNHVPLLMEEIGPTGKVFAVDGSDDKLNVTRSEMETRMLSNQIELHKADLRKLPFETNSMDWIWCADTLWPIADFEPSDGLREFRRVLRPGGKLGLYYWTHQNFLPGYPLLESKLNHAYTKRNPYLNHNNPEQHFLCADKWLERHSFAMIDILVFPAQIKAQLTSRQKRGLECCMEMLWGNLEDELSTADWKQFQELRQPGSDVYILDNSHYHAEIYYTLFLGSSKTS